MEVPPFPYLLVCGKQNKDVMMYRFLNVKLVAGWPVCLFSMMLVVQLLTALGCPKDQVKIYNYVDLHY